MSFPAFKYKEIIKENWDDCELHQYFSETKFLFAVFEKDGDCYRFKEMCIRDRERLPA